MKLKFDKKGNLFKDIIASPAEFKKLFGYNAQRQGQINNLFTIASIIHAFGCTEMYIVGSFVTDKKLPNDLDVCFNAEGLDYAALKLKYPAFFSREGLKMMHDTQQIHLFFYASYDTEMLEWFRLDRDNNKKGIVKVPLKD